MPTIFEGSNALIRHAWESVVGVTPYNATWHYFRFNSETLAAQAPTIQPNSLRGGRQRTRGLPSKITAAGPVAVDLEPSGHGYLLAQFQKGEPAVTTLTALQSFRHKLAPSYTTINHDKTSTFQISRNDRMPQLSPGCYISSFGIVANIQSVIVADFGVSSQRASYYPMPTVVVEAATPIRPILRGFPKYAVASAADPDVYLTVSNVTGQVTVKVGAAGTPTAAQVITAGTWTTLNYNNGSADVTLGDPDNPVQVYLPAFTGWTVADSWRFKFDHTDNATPWTATFPTIEAMNEIHVGITVDGVTTYLRELTLNAALGVDPNFHLGGRYSDGLLETGLRSYSGQLNRRKIDNALMKRLEAGEPFELDVIITSRVNIGSSLDPYRIRLVAPLCVFNGSNPGVPGPNILEEPFPFDCYPDPADGTHPDELTVYLDNGIADMTV